MRTKKKKFSSIIITKTFLTVVSIGFAVFFLTGNSRTVPVNAKTESTSINQRSGASIYREFCISCHGADGKANTPRGKRKGASDLTKSTISFAKGVRVIRNGRSLMPSFKNDLTAEEIKRVNTYVRGFRK